MICMAPAVPVVAVPAAAAVCYPAGAITLSALEGRSGRDSPQTLVTCIVRADWGGWLSSKSTMYGLGQVRRARAVLEGPQAPYRSIVKRMTTLCIQGVLLKSQIS